MLTKHELLAPLAQHRGDAVVVTTMGVVRPWGRYSKSELDFASADSAMGHAADLALGIALAQPHRKVICLNGDGSMLMTLGTLLTIVQAGAKNLMLFVVQNATYEITGNQAVPGGDRVDFRLMAEAAGFARTYHFEAADDYAASLPQVLAGEGPVMAVVRVEPGSEGPISRSAAEASHYLKVSLAESAHRLRAALGGPARDS